MMKEQIDYAFTFRKCPQDRTDKCIEFRAKIMELAYLINDMAPNSREKSMAITKLEETHMWGNAAIIRPE